jgi:hypothetical protein
MANQNGTVFSRLLNTLRRGRTGIDDNQQKKILTNQPINPYGSIEQKQQEFLDVQSSKIAYDLYTRSIYYDTDRLSAYNDFKAMDLSPEVSAALDILTDEVCLEENTIIPLLNGKKLKIKELFEENYENFWVYSYDTNKQKIIPAKCEKVIYKGEKDVYEITFDDNSKVLATEDHKWLLKGKNEYLRTKDLSIGQSLEPIYSKISDKTDKINGYEMLLEGGKWKYTHRIVKESVYPNEKGVVHHVDFCKTNNQPENLKVMNYFEHQKLHSSLNSERWEKNESFREKMINIFKNNSEKWKNSEWAEKTKKSFSNGQKKRWNKTTEAERKKHGKSGELNGMFKKGYKLEGNKNGKYRHDVKREFSLEELFDARNNTNSFEEAANYLNTTTIILRRCESYKKLNLQRWEDIDFLEMNLTKETLKKACLEYDCKNINRSYGKICEKNKWEKRKVTSFLNKNGYKTFSKFTETINHSVKEIKYVGKKPVYDLVNVGEYNNFAILTSEKSGVFTHNCTRSEKGEILQIYSNNSRIKNVLKDLFHNSLNINYNLMFWTREMLKFGDCFLKLEVDRQSGIYDCTALPVQEIHREESYDGNLNSARFRWDLNNMYFEEWQVAHFRIATDGSRLPYGRSILEPARKLWKQLQLAEDAMLVYRLIRAPERRVYYIEVGNTDPKDIPQYMEKMKASVKKASVVDPTTGQVNLKYNPLTYEEDYFIPVRNGQSTKVETLQGAANLNDIMDIEYLQNKLFAAIKVPKAYLNYAEKMEGGSTLAQTDLRFARTVNRIQEMVLVELRRLANIHLFMLGFQDDMDNFDLKLTNPSTQQELLKLEVIKARLEVFKEMFSTEVGSPSSYTWAMQNILGFSDSEIKLILNQKKVEKKMFAEIEEAAENYTKTGIFKEIDEKFSKGDDMQGGETPSPEAGSESPMGGGESTPEAPEAGKEEPELPTGGEAPEGGETLSENILLSENRKLYSKTKSLLDNLDRKFKDLDKKM